jgi:2-oxoglutarate ferredoxin oxidoreductase subunit alpha
MKDRFAIKISGPAGTGVMQAGETLSKALNRLGFYTLVYPEYPSRIRGGDNHIQVIFSSNQALSPQLTMNLLLAFGKANYEAHLSEVDKEGKSFEAGDLGLDQIAKDLGNPITVNTAGLGFLWAVLGFDLETLKDQIKEDLQDKEGLLDLNLKAAEKGFSKAQTEDLSLGLNFSKAKDEIVNLTGNEALTKGILEAKCEFAAIYPMTPINAILSLLAKEQVKVFRPEDEIAGIMAAIGAAYAGDRAMVATSGGGFSLMIEGLGLAGIAEIPLVIVLGQRTGPSTGMATFSSQADLNFAINAGHGEFSRIVLTPGDLEEAYRLGGEAFNLADKYQVPVILMTDKYLAENRLSVAAQVLNSVEISVDRGKLTKTTDNTKEMVKRYEFTSDHISPRVFPGEATFLTNSYEHDEFGFSTDDPEVREKMMEKRDKKLASLTDGFEVYGNKEAETTLIGWGSTKEILLDYITDHPEFNLVHFWRPWPFPKKAEAVLRKANKLIVVEGNFSGQLADLIEQETGIKPEKILKDNGRPFYKEELETAVRCQIK